MLLAHIPPSLPHGCGDPSQSQLSLGQHSPALSFAARYCQSSHHPNPIKSSGGGWQDKQLRAAPHYSENGEQRTTRLYQRIKAYQVPPSQPENTTNQFF